jgi:hypothetical protein
MTDCKHTRTRVKWYVVECQDCGHMHNVVVTTPLVRFSEMLQSVRQGRIDRETAILDPEWSDEQRDLLSTMPVCPHDKIEEYECSCTHGKRWRCKSCGLAADSSDVFKRLGGRHD